MTSDKHPLEVFLKSLSLHERLDEDDRRAVLALPYRLRRLDAGSHPVREGSVPSHCAILVDGFAARQKTTGSGARQILALCIPGDAVDLLNLYLDVSDHSVQLLTRGTVADVQRQAIQDLLGARPAIAAAIMRLTLVEASILREWVVNIGRRNAHERVAHILCEFAVRLETQHCGLGPDFELPMTQEQLADATGLTSVHVNRVLKKLEREGLIWRMRRIIKIPDWRRLQDVADFSRAYLHISTQDIVATPHGRAA